MVAIPPLTHLGLAGWLEVVFEQASHWGKRAKIRHNATMNVTEKPPLQSAKKFYFLEYFYVLLRSVEKYTDEDQAFNSFKTLKQQHRLGESKYKRLTSENENLSKVQLDRFRYTFEQVIEESKEYELLSEDDIGKLHLTENGKNLLMQFQDEGPISFNQSLFKLMERKYNAFKYLIDFLYAANRHKSGLLVFPNYSPRQLHFERPTFRTTSHFVRYSKALFHKLQEDIENHLGQQRDLREENEKLLNKLFESGLLSPQSNADFPPEKYNVITKRFRDFWITYVTSQ